MNYGKMFTYVFDDDDWITKVLVGSVVSIIPIINFAGYGYMIELVKKVRDGEPQPLPEWDEFGKFFVDGLKLTLGIMVYLIPVFLLSFMTIPFAIVGGENPGGLIQLAIVSISCLMVFFSLLPAVLAPALVVQFAKRDQISDMLAVSEIWELIKADFGTYVIMLIMYLVVLSFVASIGFIACGIGVMFTAWYAMLVGGNMIGQFAALQPGVEKDPLKVS